MFRVDRDNAMQLEKTLCLKGKISHDGKLEFEFPEGFEPIEVQIAVSPAQNEASAEVESQAAEPPFTDEEIRQMLTVTPKTMGEILESGLIGSWTDWDKGDPAEWVASLRLRGHDDAS